MDNKTINRPYLPREIAAHVNGLPFSEDGTGMSDSRVLLFENAVLKIEHSYPTAENEARMLMWAEERLRVPRVLAHKVEDGIQYLLMSRLDGVMACDPSYLLTPMRLAERLAEALCTVRAVPMDGCPHKTTPDDRLAFARRQLECGEEQALSAPVSYHNRSFPSRYALYDWLYANRPTESPSLTHGDFCLPNVFFDHTGIPGFLDLGQMGISDYNYDLALCHHSLWYNYLGAWGGPVYPNAEKSAALLFDALGITPDFDVLDYYVLLDMI